VSVEVGGANNVEFTLRPHVTLLKPEGASTEPMKHFVVMACSDYDSARRDDCVGTLLDEFTELMVERFVHFVQQQNVGNSLLGNSEAKSGAHSL
jgi:hypothetical protein